MEAADQGPGVAQQLTKLQQFLLKENNDFREGGNAHAAGTDAVASFSIKNKDVHFRGKDAATNSGTDPDSTWRNDINNSDENDNTLSGIGEHTFRHDSWPYLSEEHMELSNESSHSGDEEEDGNGGGRERRSLRKWKYLQRGREKTMEMLVVVDKSMLDRHGSKNVTTYTLTLFNMVRFVWFGLEWAMTGGFRIRLMLLLICFPYSFFPSFLHSWSMCVNFYFAFLACTVKPLSLKFSFGFCLCLGVWLLLSNQIREVS